MRSDPQQVSATLADVTAQVLEPLTAPQPTLAGQTAAVVGLGYVGLPTALCLYRAGAAVIGLDINDQRLAEIASGRTDLLPLASDQQLLRAASGDQNFSLSSDPQRLAEADLILICVPTPIDELQRPLLGPLEAACASVVAQARAGQAIILTSTTSVGSTRRLLVEPLMARGLEVGVDVSVAFAPERINPGDALHQQQTVPRVWGAASDACATTIEPLLAAINPHLHRLPSPEYAEMTKLQENSFRAVNIALANEMADLCHGFGLDPLLVIAAAQTKPYGFLAHYPGAGAGGHCIPCDPHYLLAGAAEQGQAAPVLRETMVAINRRPTQVSERIFAILAELGLEPRQARILVTGVSYKGGVADMRQTPATEILATLAAAQVDIAYHDPLIGRLALSDDQELVSVADPGRHACDLVVAITLHPGHDYAWLDQHPQLLDCSYRQPPGPGQTVYLI